MTYDNGNYENELLVKRIINRLYSGPKNEVALYCLQDFDMFGHRKDAPGYATALKKFDMCIPQINNALRDDDLLVITADHGCDPTLAKLRGHTREFAPLLFYSKKPAPKQRWLGIRQTFADLGQTICYNFSLAPIIEGKIIYELF